MSIFVIVSIAIVLAGCFGMFFGYMVSKDRLVTQKNKIIELDDEVSMVNSAVEAMIEANDRLNARNTQLSSELELVTAKYDELIEIRDFEFEETSARLDALVQEINTLTNTIDELLVAGNKMYDRIEPKYFKVRHHWESLMN